MRQSPTISLGPLTYMLTISKAKRVIGFLFRVFKEADEPFLSKLYKAIVLPHLEYCSCVWDPPFTKYITALECVQSFAARVVTNTCPLSLFLWSSRFSGPRSVNAATFKNSAYVAEFSVVFPSFPVLFSSIYSPSLLAQELLSSLPLFREDTSSQILLQTLRGVH